MDITTFTATYKDKKDADKIEIKCDHPECVNPIRTIGKQPAKRNIMKNGGTQFICRDCMMKHNNPMTHVGVSRQTDETIDVLCPCCNNTREIRKAAYFGSMELPYRQICRGCSQEGRVVSEGTRQKISESLSGIERSDEFKANLSEYMRNNPEGIERGKANLVPGYSGGWNKGLTMPPEVGHKISEANSGQTRTPEQCQNISQGRREYFERIGGMPDETKEKISRSMIERYKDGFNPFSHHRRGHYESKKTGKTYCYRSSYELKAFHVLDEDDSVETYEYEAVPVVYRKPGKHHDSMYLIDFFVRYKDGSTSLIEVKPAFMCELSMVKAKFEAAFEFAKLGNHRFEVWTEAKFHMTQQELTAWADEYEVDLEYAVKRITPKEAAARRQRRHYERRVASDKVEVFCEYCQETHTPLRLTYDKNIARNGRYICEREGGHISGSKPKLALRKENPYAADGKKQCMGPCGQVLEFKFFGADKSRRDGYADKCKACRAAKGKAAYQAKKAPEAAPE